MFFELIGSPIELLIIHSIALAVLLIGTFTDLRTREVPDWVNIGLIGIGFGVNLIFSIFFWDYSYILSSVVGFFVIFALGWAMFYSGQWGGGDSKMLMGLGALVGIDIFSGKIPFLAHFLVNIVIVGALYGVIWTIYLIIKNWTSFYKEAKKLMKDKFVLKVRLIVYALFIVLLAISFFAGDRLIKLSSLYIAVVLPVTLYVWVAVKSVEKSCMIKTVPPKDLTEGDWIAKEVKVNGKVIAGPKDLGVEKKQIKKLIQLYKQKKIKNVKVKEGIPFVPSFLAAYLTTLILGNVAFLFI